MRAIAGPQDEVICLTHGSVIQFEAYTGVQRSRSGDLREGGEAYVSLDPCP